MWQSGVFLELSRKSNCVYSFARCGWVKTRTYLTFVLKLRIDLGIPLIGIIYMVATLDLIFKNAKIMQRVVIYFLCHYLDCNLYILYICKNRLIKSSTILQLVFLTFSSIIYDSLYEYIFSEIRFWNKIHFFTFAMK